MQETGRNQCESGSERVNGEWTRYDGRKWVVWGGKNQSETDGEVRGVNVKPREVKFWFRHMPGYLMNTSVDS